MTHDDELRSRMQRLATTHELGDLSADDIVARRPRGFGRQRLLAVAAVVVLVVAVAGVIRLTADDGGTDADVASGVDEPDDVDDAAATTTTTTTEPPVADAASGSAASDMAVSFGGLDTVLPWGDGFVSFGQVFEPSDVTMADLVPDIADRLPTEVMEVVGDVTDIDEATALLEAAGLLDEATDAVMADPEMYNAYSQVIAGGTYRPEASVSADGQTWTRLDDFALPGGSDYVSLAQSDGEHLVVVEQLWDDTGTTSAITVSTTTDLVEWNSQVVPVVAANDAPAYAHVDSYASDLALGAGGWYLTVGSGSYVDVWALLPDDVRTEIEATNYGWTVDERGVVIESGEYGGYYYDSGELATTTTIADESSERRVIPWSDLGITYADYEQYNGNGVSTLQAWRGSWNGAVESATPASDSECCDVVGTDAGFIAAGWPYRLDESSAAILRFSADGIVWNDLAGPPSGGELQSLAAVEGGVIGVDGSGTIWRAAADGTGWTPVDLPGLPDGANLWFGQSGGRGVATVIDVATYDYEYEQVPYVVTIEQDGYEIRSETAADGTNTVQVTELATGAMVIDEIIDPQMSVMPDFIRYDEFGTDVTLLDAEGEVVVTVSMATFDEATSQAITEAQAESGWVEPDYDYTPDLWLVATADGINWIVEDLDGDGEDVGFGSAAINGDVVVARSAEGSWVRFTIG
ncbi:MAG: hypothetical protein R2707_08905 [Acidimicrobiales bacterium]